MQRLITSSLAVLCVMVLVGCKTRTQDKPLRADPRFHFQLSGPGDYTTGGQDVPLPGLGATAQRAAVIVNIIQISTGGDSLLADKPITMTDSIKPDTNLSLPGLK